MCRYWHKVDGMEKSPVVRLLGLLPAFLGLALETMMQVGPGEAETNLCKWFRLIVPNAKDACLHGLPTIWLQLLPAALIISGLAWLFWSQILPGVFLRLWNSHGPYGVKEMCACFPRSKLPSRQIDFQRFVCRRNQFQFQRGGG